MAKGQPAPWVNAFQGAQLNSLQYNISQNGSPIPMVYGTVRCSIDVAEFFGFQVHGAGGGKGGGKGFGQTGGKGKGSANQTYSVNVAFILCEGPVTYSGASHGVSGSNRVWANGAVKTVATASLNTYTGTDGQAPDPTFVSLDTNTPVVNYSGTAYVTVTPMQLGSSPALPNFSVEVGGRQVGTVGAAFPDDANPSKIIEDLLTNSRDGAGFPSANLDISGTLANFGTYCQAAQIAMSLYVDRQQAAGRWIDEICQLTVAAAVWSGSLLKVIPYSDQTWSNNGATWNPILTSRYSLTDDDFLTSGVGDTDVVVITRKDVTEASNWMSIEFKDSLNNYNSQIIPFFDQALIDQFGLRTEATVQGHEFTNATSATVSIGQQLRRRSYVRNTFKFRLPWRFCLLEPMDIVEITDSTLGLSAFPVRIIQIDEDDNGELAITAEELPSNPFVLPDRQDTAGSGIDFFADPGSANTPAIFEPPSAFTGGRLLVYLIASGASENWGGCQVWISFDDTTYAIAGTLYKGARQGVLTADLPAGTDPDVTNTLSVNLTESFGELLSGTTDDANNYVTLCYIEGATGELISYETATFTSAYHYDLTYLRRGAYGTSNEAHTSGAQFARFGPTDPSLFTYEYPSNYIGRTIYIKLLSFNTFGMELESLSDVAPIAYTLGGGGIGLPTYLANGSMSGPTPSGGIIVFQWAMPNTVVFGTDFAGSVARAEFVATADAVYTIKNNGTPIGTITFAAGANTGTFSSSATTPSFLPGTELTIDAPASPDATLSGLAWNFKGRMSSTATNAVEIHGSMSGPFAPSLVIGRWVCENPVVITDDVSRHFASCQVAATADKTFSIQKNGVEFMTMTYTAGVQPAVFAYTGAGTSTTFNMGDVITVVGPVSTDATLTGLAWGFTAVNSLTNPLTFITGAQSGPIPSGIEIYHYVFASTFVISPGMPGSIGVAGGAGVGSTAFDIKKNGTTVGTMTFGAGATTAVFAMTSTTTFNPGDSITVVAPASPDASLFDLAWNFAGSM